MVVGVARWRRVLMYMRVAVLFYMNNCVMDGFYCRGIGGVSARDIHLAIDGTDRILVFVERGIFVEGIHVLLREVGEQMIRTAVERLRHWLARNVTGSRGSIYKDSRRRIQCTHSVVIYGFLAGIPEHLLEYLFIP